MEAILKQRVYALSAGWEDLNDSEQLRHDSLHQLAVMDFDATDFPVHGEQEGRFFHGYYNRHCFLPLYVFCGGDSEAAGRAPSQGLAEDTLRLPRLFQSH